MSLNILLYISAGLLIAVIVALIVDRATDKSKKNAQEQEISVQQKAEEGVQNSQQVSELTQEEKGAEQSQSQSLSIGDIEDDAEAVEEKQPVNQLKPQASRSRGISSGIKPVKKSGFQPIRYEQQPVQEQPEQQEVKEEPVVEVKPIEKVEAEPIIEVKPVEEKVVEIKQEPEVQELPKEERTEEITITEVQSQEAKQEEIKENEQPEVQQQTKTVKPEEVKIEVVVKQQKPKEEKVIEKKPDNEEDRIEQPLHAVRGNVDMGKTAMFTLKMSGANPVIQESYNKINNALLSYRNVERYYDKNYVDYFYDEKLCARLSINGSAMKLYLNLPKSACDEKVYFHKETTEVTGLKIFINIKSEKAGNNAVELIHIMGKKRTFEKKAWYKDVDSMAELKTLNTRK